jgi:3-oxoacyl-[acyl-carrier protein] reductase
MRAVARLMLHQGAGAIVCMSCGAGESTPWTTYLGGAGLAAKAGIRWFIRDAAMELAEHGIRVNALAPSRIETEQTSKMSPARHRVSLAGDHIATKRACPQGRLSRMSFGCIDHG